MSISLSGQKAARGFTLIEMSIVLVIIGLIIGGILKGQEIIGNARSKAVVNQINAIRSATSTYFDRYHALPGDDANAPARLDARLVAGNANGVVGANAGATEATMTAADGRGGENYQFFKGLLAANLIGGGEVTPVGTVAATSFGVNSPLPSSPVSGAGVTVMYGAHDGDGTASTLRSAHWFRVHKSAATAAAAAAFTPRELAGIDAQTDDGMPGSGQVRGSVAGACYATGAGGLYVLGDNTGCVGYFEGPQ